MDGCILITADTAPKTAGSSWKVLQINIVIVTANPVLMMRAPTFTIIPPLLHETPPAIIHRQFCTYWESKSLCDAVHVVDNPPACKLPCNALAAPPSDCISITRSGCPKIFFLPWEAHTSTTSAIVEEGVICINHY